MVISQYHFSLATLMVLLTPSHCAPVVDVAVRSPLDNVISASLSSGFQVAYTKGNLVLPYVIFTPHHAFNLVSWSVILAPSGITVFIYIFLLD